jgi:hypothetical protein
MAFTYKLEQEDGTPADPPDIPHGRTYLGGGWHDPAGRRTLRGSRSETRTQIGRRALVVESCGKRPTRRAGGEGAILNAEAGGTSLRISASSPTPPPPRSLANTGLSSTSTVRRVRNGTASHDEGSRRSLLDRLLGR